MVEVNQNVVAYILSRDDCFRYQLLDRMRQDCHSDLAKLSCRWETRVADDGRNHITGKDDGGRGCTC